MTQVDEDPEANSRPVMTFGAPAVGEILADRYRLEELVSEDPSGRQVWRGVDVVLRRPVAIVLRHPGGESADEMLRAAVAASRVAHANVVGVYDAIDEGHRAYVVREWVDGAALRDYVAQAPLSPARATTVGHAVAAAVAAVHQANMVHGNVHPGSVLIDNDGRVVLGDAQADGDGTRESDIRSVGGVLYYALTGRWPHAELPLPHGRDLPDAVRDEDGRLATPRQVRAGVPAYLDKLTADLLDPQVAVPTADSLAAELGRLDAEAEAEAAMEEFFESPLGSALGGQAPRPTGRKIAVGVTALALVAIAGLLVSAKFLSPAGARDPDGGGVVTAPPSVAPTVGEPEPIKLTADQLRVIDPPGGDRTELGGVEKVIDGDVDTGWTTDTYTYPEFGRLKDGMGILIDLGEPRRVQVKVVLSATGASVQLRTGTSDFPPTSDGDKQLYESYRVEQEHLNYNGTTMVFNPPKEPTRYLLVWITSLPQVGEGRYKLGVQEIELTPR